MVKRSWAICFTYWQWQLSTEFKKIRKIGIKNDYSNSFINTLIGVNLIQHLNKSDDGELAPTTTVNDQEIATVTKFNENNKKCMYVEIPLIGDSTTYAMKKKMLYLSNKLHPDVNIKFYTTLPLSIQTFFKNKDLIVKHM